MLMSRNTASTSPLVQLAQRRGGVGGAAHLADAGCWPQQVGQLVERRRLVVDGEHRQCFASRQAHLRRPLARTPDRNFGTRITTLVPAPIAVSTTRP